MSRSDSSPASTPLPALSSIRMPVTLLARAKARASRKRGAAGQAQRALDHRPVDPLDPGHRVGLPLDALAPVDDPEPPLQGHGPRHLAAGDAVHVGGQDGQLEASGCRSDGR